MRFQAGIQILLLIISVIIVATVLKPKFSEIQYSQNEISQYLNALDKAGQYNQRLQELLGRAASIPQSSRQALNLFLPNQVDTTLVSRDIRNIVERNGLLLLELETKGGDAATVSSARTGVEAADGFVEQEPLVSEARQNLSAERFTLSAIGSYQQMKNMLRDMERNSYPLRLVVFEFEAPDDSSLYNYSLELEAYALER